MLFSPTGSYIKLKMMSAITKVTEAEVPTLVKLINSAYRGISSKKGWTTEADLLDGVRVNEQILTSMLRTPGAVILKYSNAAGAPEGCVYL